MGSGDGVMPVAKKENSQREEKTTKDTKNLLGEVGFR